MYCIRRSAAASVRGSGGSCRMLTIPFRTWWKEFPGPMSVRHILPDGAGNDGASYQISVANMLYLHVFY